MRLSVLGSNSNGNGYILEAVQEALVIETGVRLSEYKKALGWRLNKVAGAIVTHEHNDHAGYIREFVKAGVKVYALPEVFASHDLLGKPFTKDINPRAMFKVGGFKVMAITVEHDCPCVAYLIEHAEMGRLLFVTDTMNFTYRVPNLTHLMLEANYADDILDRRIADGLVPPSMRPRLLKSHLEIGNTKGILSRQDLTGVNDIVLIHLSEGNSDEQRFVREVRELTGKDTYAAKAGMTLDISVTPY